ncbi:hypothetical protein [Halalkalicoccus subterraneus]|uniref:hypothetical protein n=1 Tax=Halalkalicoccus subterraneus TaxID=2675002 RepID=UPI0013CF0B13|nr:hypothetical protein [Halalkalicoccus subterraneus]
MVSRGTVAAIVFAVVLVMSGGCTGLGDDGDETESGPESDGNGAAQDGVDPADDGGSGSDESSSTTEGSTESNETGDEGTVDSDELNEEEAAEEKDEATNESEDTAVSSEGEGETNGQDDDGVDEDDAAEGETMNEPDDQETSDETAQTADVTAFEESLRDEGIDVSSVEQEGDTLSLGYETSRTDEEVVEAEGAIVAGSYADLTGEGYGSERLEATIYHATTGERIADYHIESEWAEQYNDGEISSAEYEERVTATIDTHV